MMYEDAAAAFDTVPLPVEDETVKAQQNRSVCIDLAIKALGDGKVLESTITDEVGHYICQTADDIYHYILEGIIPMLPTITEDGL